MWNIEAEKCAPLDLVPLVKDFYEEDPEITNLTAEEVAEIRKQNNNIMVNTLKEENYHMIHEDEKERNIAIPKPVRTFENAFRKYPIILQQLKKQNFEKPSPIQCQAWPILLQGIDLVGIAQTGTGKTLAFLLPALIHIDGQTTPRQERLGPTCLVLAPTRELALQIHEEVKKINYKGIKSMCIYGGASRRDQLSELEDDPSEIIVATPGRLNDFIESKKIDMSNVSYVVLDEADRMLDMGFSYQIRKCLIPTRPDKQVVMTTATWSFDAQTISRLWYKKAIKVDVGSLDLTATHTVTQNFIFLDDRDKRDWLFEFIDNISKEEKVIIFVARKSDVDDLSSTLAIKGFDCESIHGGREQIDRESALNYFRNNTVNILIATDVASRGLDICDITKIVNYDFPKHIEEYVHRIGRTGRAGKEGEALTILTRYDSQHASGLIKILDEANQEIPQELVKLAERHKIFESKKNEEREQGRGRGGGRGRGRGGGQGRGGGGFRSQTDYSGSRSYQRDSTYQGFEKPSQEATSQGSSDYWNFENNSQIGQETSSGQSYQSHQAETRNSQRDDYQSYPKIDQDRSNDQRSQLYQEEAKSYQRDSYSKREQDHGRDQSRQYHEKTRIFHRDNTRDHERMRDQTYNEEGRNPQRDTYQSQPKRNQDRRDDHTRQNSQFESRNDHRDTYQRDPRRAQSSGNAHRGQNNHYGARNSPRDSYQNQPQQGFSRNYDQRSRGDHNQQNIQVPGFTNELEEVWDC